MSTRFRRILVTGASSGIGAALALEFAAPDALLVLYGRNAERLDQTARACHNAGAHTRVDAFDLRTPGAVATRIRTLDAEQPLDLVLACAGVSASRGPNDEDERREDLLRLLAVNAQAAVETLHAAAERMRSRGRGSIALIGSLGGMVGQPSSPGYSASKGAAMLYAAGLRAALAPHGVRLTVVAPGFVDTPMSRRYIGAKPFLIDARTAAKRIRAGLETGKAEIGFPRALHLGLKLLPLLPPTLADAVFRRFFHHRVEEDEDAKREAGRP